MLFPGLPSNVFVKFQWNLRTGNSNQEQKDKRMTRWSPGRAQIKGNTTLLGLVTKGLEEEISTTTLFLLKNEYLRRRTGEVSEAQGPRMRHEATTNASYTELHQSIETHATWHQSKRIKDLHPTVLISRNNWLKQQDRRHKPITKEKKKKKNRA
ncbi:hypothetical protein QQP08_011337 [Theobroma cacao]|nr:hypothetical protein QQP08_011337 [Theobroma cacao]